MPGTAPDFSLIARLYQQAQENPGAAPDLARVGRLYQWAQEHDRELLFWQVVYSTLPRPALSMVRYGYLAGPTADSSSNWRYELKPLRRLACQFDDGRLDNTMFGGRRMLAPGTGLVSPTMLSCAGELAEPVSRLIEAEEDLDTPGRWWNTGKSAKTGRFSQRECHPQAQQVYRVILAALPKNSAEARFARCYCAIQMDPANEVAVENLAELCSKPRAPYRWHWLLAELLTSGPANPETAKHLETVTERLSESSALVASETWYWLHHVWRAQGNLDLAGYYLESYHQCWPWLPQATCALAQLAQERGAVAQYRRWCDETVRLDGEDGPWAQRVRGTA